MSSERPHVSIERARDLSAHRRRGHPIAAARGEPPSTPLSCPRRRASRSQGRRPAAVVWTPAFALRHAHIFERAGASVGSSPPMLAGGVFAASVPSYAGLTRGCPAEVLLEAAHDIDSTRVQSFATYQDTKQGSTPCAIPIASSTTCSNWFRGRRSTNWSPNLEPTRRCGASRRGISSWRCCSPSSAGRPRCAKSRR